MWGRKRHRQQQQPPPTGKWQQLPGRHHVQRPRCRHHGPEWLPIGRSVGLVLALLATAVLLPRRVGAEAPATPHRITIIGSGNFGSAVARLLGRNVLELPHLFAPDVRMWVFEEMWEGRKLTEVINETRENPKYLPGVRLPPNVRAVPDLEAAARDASVLVFVLPHQFVGRVLPTLRACVRPGALAVSLIKGLDFAEDKPVLISDVIRRGLGPTATEVCVLMGANVADEVARDEFCEATIGCRDQAAGQLLQQLFDCPSFRVDVTNDPTGVELCGALKNVVALGAGFCDGLGYGCNTKAAVIRRGLEEMRRFCQAMDPAVQDATFFESSGVGDLITTCFGGRNRRCAERFAQAAARGAPVAWEDLEREELGGQKLQGTHTAAKLYEVLRGRGLLRTGAFPLFKAVFEVAFQGRHPSAIVTDLARRRKNNNDGGGSRGKGGTGDG